ncbi:hypothetical protein LX16_3384 [Stackebrandtia albiflava]|uniref:AAA domain-containing protein n=1 Tax=Stackebrandtia albiflava TaxID=406432 RepID=A0A562V427_9ACTN|nr:ATPase [Stackebrandtia albiflava]TWJ12623.1 hypothetical protein LX16_3384 [Stackebrandtia albiflava]
MVVAKPAEVFARDHEWDALCRFVQSDKPGLTIGIVRGRRRHGKSWLLEHACAAMSGVYTLALRQSRKPALRRFAEQLSQAVGHELGEFTSWTQALNTAVTALARTATGNPLLVLDEFPYLVAHSPELPSVIQALYDEHAPGKNGPPFRLILCGSAVSVMSTLARGDQALRGRTILDLRVERFDFRESARYWDVTPDVGFLIDSVLGGAAGYRDIVDGVPADDDADGFFSWLATGVLDPSHVLFTEPDYLLSEDPRIGDRAVYHSIWESAAAGASTPTRIGGDVGMEAKTLSYHLGIMRDAAFLRYEQDMLLQRKPVITVADPVVRFHNLIVRPQLAALEARHTARVWESAEDVFRAKVLGPHFEQIARDWVYRYGQWEGLADIGQVGTTQVPCRRHRGHQVDVLALNAGGIARSKSSRITVIGEAKCTRAGCGTTELARLEHIRETLVDQGWNAAEARLVLFSRNGFGDELRGTEAVLVDLATLYGRAGVAGTPGSR